MTDVADASNSIPTPSVAADEIRRVLGIDVFCGAVILGSGFGDLLAGEEPITYRDIAGFPRCGVAGHAGEIGVVSVGDSKLLVFSGRLHAYEKEPAAVTFPVDLARELGARRLLLTCAAGGIRADLTTGQLVVVEDHLNLAGTTPSIAPHDFLDLSQVYEPGWRAALMDVAAKHRIVLPSGVLAWVRGPAYETPAEVRMLGRLGADLVSMSTVPEAVRARALGMEVAAVAVIANPAGGQGSEPVRHVDVLDTVRAAVDRQRDFLLGALATAVPGET